MSNGRSRNAGTGETLAAFHAREKAKPPTLAEIFAKNRADKVRCAKTPDMLGPDLAEVRRLYVETDMPNNVIGERYGKAPNWVNNLATKHGWPIRKFAKADSARNRIKGDASLFAEVA